MADFTTQSFISGLYQAPTFSPDFPGPFVSPTRRELTTVLAGNALSLATTAPAGGGILSLEVYERANPGVNVLDDDDHISLEGQGAPAAGDQVVFTSSGHFTASLTPDTYFYAFVHATGTGDATVTAITDSGSFDVLPVGF